MFSLLVGETPVPETQDFLGRGRPATGGFADFDDLPDEIGVRLALARHWKITDADPDVSSETYAPSQQLVTDSLLVHGVANGHPLDLALAELPDHVNVCVQTLHVRQETVLPLLAEEQLHKRSTANDARLQESEDRLEMARLENGQIRDQLVVGVVLQHELLPLEGVLIDARFQRHEGRLTELAVDELNEIERTHVQDSDVQLSRFHEREHSLEAHLQVQFHRLVGGVD